jgi:hypothetical protein
MLWPAPGRELAATARTWCEWTQAEERRCCACCAGLSCQTACSLCGCCMSLVICRSGSVREAVDGSRMAWGLDRRPQQADRNAAETPSSFVLKGRARQRGASSLGVRKWRIARKYRSYWPLALRISLARLTTQPTANRCPTELSAGWWSSSHGSQYGQGWAEGKAAAAGKRRGL